MKLVLAIGQHDPDYVDAYYGPQEWKKPGKKPLDAIARGGDTVTRATGEDFRAGGRVGAVATQLFNKATIRARSTSAHIKRRTFEVR